MPQPPDTTSAGSGGQVVRRYLDTVFRRFEQPMDPVQDRPRPVEPPPRYKTYTGAPLIPLPVRLPRGERSLADIYRGTSAPAGCPGAATGLTLADLAWLLRLSYGVLSRRMRVDGNHDGSDRRGYPTALWGRGTPSGGGRYPLELYWVTGAHGAPGGLVLPGIYHYAVGHHAVERLAVGDLADRVRSAVHSRQGTPWTDQYLLVSGVFARTAVRYGSLGYHVITQDVGTLLGSWDLLAAGLGMSAHRFLWFDDEALNQLLGLRTSAESVLAVVPLPAEAPPAAARGPHDADSTPAAVRLPACGPGQPALDNPIIERVHRASLGPAGPPACPATVPTAVIGGLPASRGPGPPRRTVRLPPPLLDRLTEPVSALLARRRSSFGGLVPAPPLDLTQLATVLAVAAWAGRQAEQPSADGSGLARLSILVNRVTGLPAAAYRYDADRHAVVRADPGVADGRMSAFLRTGHHLANYNPDQAAVVLTISARLDAVLRGHGARGYRALNAAAGSVAQAGHLAATALGLGCGLVLGIDNQAVNNVLGFDGVEEATVLFLLLGRDRPDRADFDGEPLSG